MKTPDESKKGLECCIEMCCRGNCPYFEDPECTTSVRKDALALIRQLEAENAELSGKVGRLEAERDAAVADVKSVCATNYCSGNYCEYCKHNESDGQCHHPCVPYSSELGWEWRGVQKGE